MSNDADRPRLLERGPIWWFRKTTEPDRRPRLENKAFRDQRCVTCKFAVIDSGPEYRRRCVNLTMLVHWHGHGAFQKIVNQGLRGCPLHEHYGGE